jgi:putative endopeptidase
MLHHVRRIALFAALAIVSAEAGAQGTYVQAVPIDPANINRNANACADFNAFANGGWLNRTQIPAAFSRWGSFDELGERNQAALQTILTDVTHPKGRKLTRNERLVADYYTSCMDSVTAERLGAQPLWPTLRQINAVTNRNQLQRELARLHLQGVPAVFGFGATQDAKNSESVIGGAVQGGLTLPSRDYYLDNGARFQQIRKDYVAHIQNMLQLTGVKPAAAAAQAQSILALETAFAKASMSNVELRDPVKTYNRKTPSELAALTPNFNWTRYFNDLGAPRVPAVDVQNPNFMKAVDSLLVAVPLADWKAYLRWKTIKSYAGNLSSQFVNENFAFDSKLSGAKEQLPRYKRCTRAADTGLRDALGRIYVEKNFTPEAKARAMEMINNLVDVYRERINSLPWMSPDTRKQALVKLNTYVRKIGYPDVWRDYSTLTIRPGSYLPNRIATTMYERKRDLAQIGKPVDRTDWGMTTPTVNAYYNPSMNEIVFPAGIMQPPFFDPKADDAVNYGGMGAVIGHEISHGFDDQGSQFDEKGNLRNWWTDSDLKNFQAKTGLVSSQFSNYTVLDSVHVIGALTLGENIADLGGLSVAYAALQKALAKKGRPGLIDGFTPEQRFFLAWAQIWRQNIRPEAQRQRILTDPHAPAQWRTNGPLSNLPEFAEAFGCKPGDPMVRADSVRAVIW